MLLLHLTFRLFLWLPAVLSLYTHPRPAPLSLTPPCSYGCGVSFSLPETSFLSCAHLWGSLLFRLLSSQRSLPFLFCIHLLLTHFNLAALFPSPSLSSFRPCVKMVCIDPLWNPGEGQGFTNKAQGQNRDTHKHCPTHTADKYSKITEVRWWLVSV